MSQEAVCCIFYQLHQYQGTSPLKVSHQIELVAAMTHRVLQLSMSCVMGCMVSPATFQLNASAKEDDLIWK